MTTVDRQAHWHAVIDDPVSMLVPLDDRFEAPLVDDPSPLLLIIDLCLPDSSHYLQPALIKTIVGARPTVVLAVIADQPRRHLADFLQPALDVGAEQVIKDGADLAADLDLALDFHGLRLDAWNGEAALDGRRGDIDPATGLPTLARLERRLAVQARRYAQGVDQVSAALVMVDIDEFKQFVAHYDRDDVTGFLKRFGHAVREAALQMELSANRLISDQDRLPLVVRGMSDEFFVLVPLVHSLSDARIIARELLTAAMRQTPQADGLQITASAGVALFPDHGRDPSAILRAVRSALTTAQGNGPNSIAAYSSAAAEIDKTKFKLMGSISAAIDNDELALVYQPQVDILTNRITGFEALVRWRHAEFGVLPPDRFVGLAEQAGLSVDLGEWVLRRALNDMSAFQRHYRQRFSLSVNMSSDIFNREDASDIIRRVIEPTEFPLAQLILEVTESLVIDDPEHAMESISDLRQLGLRFSLDDFGTGYSALSYLKMLPFDALKIDRSFVRDIDTSPHNRVVVEAIISMAKTLGMSITAEGVERQEQLDWLTDSGCNQYQGFLCARPLELTQLSDHIARWEATPVLLAESG